MPKAMAGDAERWFEEALGRLTSVDNEYVVGA